MTPQSAKDPRAEKAAVDPAVELAREHRAAMNRLDTPGEISDDDSVEFVTNVVMPLDEKLARTRPTTREGIIAALDVAARETRRDQHEPPSGTEAMIIGVIENARDALKAGVEVPHGLEGSDPDDPFPACLAEWETACAAWSAGGQTEELDESVQAAENKIVDTPTRTIMGVVVKLRLLACLVKTGHEPADNLVTSALHGAECVMRGPGVVVGSAAAGPDPLVALWEKWYALEWHDLPEGLTDEEGERFTAGRLRRRMTLQPRSFRPRPIPSSAYSRRWRYSGIGPRMPFPTPAKPLWGHSPVASSRP